MKSAGHAHCNTNDTPIELDRKTLRKHNSSPDERSLARRRTDRHSCKPLVC